MIVTVVATICSSIAKNKARSWSESGLVERAAVRTLSAATLPKDGPVLGETTYRTISPSSAPAGLLLMLPD